MTQHRETTVPVPLYLIRILARDTLPGPSEVRNRILDLIVEQGEPETVAVPWSTLEAALHLANSSYPGRNEQLEELLTQYLPGDEPYLKRLYDGTVSDSRDLRTIGFTSSEFSNAWAVHRGKVFDTHHLSPFHEEFRSWLAKHDAELIQQVREELMAKLATDFSSKMDTAASAGVGPIVTIYSDRPFGPVDEHLAKIREIGGIESL